MQIKIVHNKRAGENIFIREYTCDGCSNFSEQLIQITTNMFSIIICKGCLTRLINILDKNMRDNFQPDFEEARRLYENETRLN